MSDNIKKAVTLIFAGENKNKFILEATINYIKFLKDSLDPFLKNDFVIIENIHLYTIFKSLKPSIFFSLFLLTF